MLVQLITPTSTKKIDVEWLDITTDQGSFVIQEDHAPMLLVMLPGKSLTYQLVNGSTKTIVIKRGIVEITRKKVRTLFIP